MPYTKKNNFVRKIKGRNNYKQSFCWQQVKGTNNYTYQYFTSCNERRAPRKNSYYNRHYNNFSNVKKYVRPAPHNVAYRPILKPINSDSQESRNPPFYPRNTSHPPVFMTNRGNQIKANYVNNSRQLNTSHPTVLMTNRGSQIKANYVNNSRQIQNFNQDIINSHLRTVSPALSSTDSGYSSSPSPAPSTYSNFSLDGLEEVPNATLQEPVNYTHLINQHGAKSDLVYDAASNSLLLTKPYEILDVPIALAPMDEEV